MRFEGPSAARYSGRRQRVVIDGVWYLLIPLSSLEGLGWDTRGSVTYPDPAPGWATTRVGSTRFCAWFEGGRTA